MRCQDRASHSALAGSSPCRSRGLGKGKRLLQQFREFTSVLPRAFQHNISKFLKLCDLAFQSVAKGCGNRDLLSIFIHLPSIRSLGQEVCSVRTQTQQRKTSRWMRRLRLKRADQMFASTTKREREERREKMRAHADEARTEGLHLDHVR